MTITINGEKRMFKLDTEKTTYMIRISDEGYAFLDCFPTEYPTGGIGDYRES